MRLVKNKRKFNQTMKNNHKIKKNKRYTLKNIMRGGGIKGKLNTIYLNPITRQEDGTFNIGYITQWVLVNVRNTSKYLILQPNPQASEGGKPYTAYEIPNDIAISDQFNNLIENRPNLSEENNVYYQSLEEMKSALFTPNNIKPLNIEKFNRTLDIIGGLIGTVKLNKYVDSVKSLDDVVISDSVKNYINDEFSEIMKSNYEFTDTEETKDGIRFELHEEQPDNYFMEKYQTELQKRKDNEFDFKTLISQYEKRTSLNFNTVFEQEERIQQNLYPDVINSRGLLSIVEIEVIPELFRLESLRDTIHDATRAEKYKKSLNFKKYIFSEMLQNGINLQRLIGDYISRVNSLEISDKIKFTRSLNDMFIILAYLVLLGPDGLNDAKMKEVTYSLENNPDCYSCYFTVVDSIEANNGESYVTIVPKLLNVPINKIFSDEQLKYSNGAYTRIKGQKENSIISFQSKNFKRILTIAHNTIDPGLITHISNLLERDETAKIEIDSRILRITGDLRNNSNVSFFSVDMVPGSGASSENSLLYQAGSEIGFYPLLDTKWLCRAVDGFTDQANDMHRGSEVRRQMATLNDLTDMRGGDTGYTRSWNTRALKTSSDDRERIGLLSIGAFANQRYFNIISPKFSDKDVLKWSLYRKAFKKEMYLPLIFGKDFNNYLRERSQFKAAGSQISLSCGKVEGYVCACQKNIDEKFLGYYKCKKTGQSLINKKACKEVISDGSQKVRIHWCPCHLHSVMKEPYMGCVDKKGRPVINEKLDDELAELLEEKTEWKSLNYLYTKKGLSACSQYCGCKGLCPGNMFLAGKAIKIMLECNPLKGKTADEIEKMMARNMDSYDNRLMMVMDFKTFELHKIEMFAFFNLLYNIYLNVDTSVELQANLIESFQEILDKWLNDVFKKDVVGSDDPNIIRYNQSVVDLLGSFNILKTDDNIDTSIVSELFFNFTYNYVKNKFSNYSSSDAWAGIDRFYNEVIKGTSEGKTSDTTDNSSVASELKTRDASNKEIISKNVICEILSEESRYKDSISAVLNEIYDDIFNSQNGESYMENWKKRLIAFYENNNVRDAHKDKEDREMIKAENERKVRYRKEYPGDKESFITESISIRYNDLPLVEAMTQARSNQLEGKYRGNEDLFRAALKKLKYPSEVISLLEPHFNKEYTKLTFPFIKERDDETGKNCNLDMCSMYEYLIHNNDDLLSWIQYAKIASLNKSRLELETKIYNEGICLYCDDLENELSSVNLAESLSRIIFSSSRHFERNTEDESKISDIEVENYEDTSLGLFYLSDPGEFSDILEQLKEKIDELVKEFGLITTRNIIEKVLDNINYYTEIYDTLMIEKKGINIEEEKDLDEDLKLSLESSKYAKTRPYQLEESYKALLATKLMDYLNKKVEENDRIPDKINDIDQLKEILRRKKNNLRYWRRIYDNIEGIVSVYSTFINAKIRESDSPGLISYQLPWVNGFMTCCYLRFVSDDIIRGADAKGENRKKTARITFYKNDETQPDMWTKNSVEQPGTSAVVMFNTMASILGKSFTPSDEHQYRLLEDVRNAKFVGDLSQMALANDFRYKCLSGDHVACGCVRFIKPNNDEPFMLFYRSKSQMSPEAIYLHVPKLNAPKNGYIVSPETEQDYSGPIILTPDRKFDEIIHLLQLRLDNPTLDAAKFLKKFGGGRYNSVESFMERFNLKNMGDIPIQDDGVAEDE